MERDKMAARFVPARTAIFLSLSTRKKTPTMRRQQALVDLPIAATWKYIRGSEKAPYVDECKGCNNQASTTT